MSVLPSVAFARGIVTLSRVVFKRVDDGSVNR
ncbi:MAG: hypothetical protein JWM11_2221 [Planctomycetaceae bacterium]|nr:hypothetical protein [Planctomycetaceae bacterium]